MSEVKSALDAGIPPKQLSKKIDMEQFSKYPGYSPRIMDVTFRRIASMFITGR